MATTTSDVTQNPAPAPGQPQPNTDPNAASSAAGKNPNPDRNKPPQADMPTHTMGNPSYAPANPEGQTVRVSVDGKEVELPFGPMTRKALYEKLDVNPKTHRIVQLLEDDFGSDPTIFSPSAGANFTVQPK